MCLYFSYFSFRNETIFRTRKKNWKETCFFHELKNKFFCSLFTEREREGKWGILTLKKGTSILSRWMSILPRNANLSRVCDSERGVIDRGAIDVIYKASWLVTSVKGLFGLPLLQIGVYWEVKLPMHLVTLLWSSMLPIISCTCTRVVAIFIQLRLVDNYIHRLQYEEIAGFEIGGDC